MQSIIRSCLKHRADVELVTVDDELFVKITCHGHELLDLAEGFHFPYARPAYDSDEWIVGALEEWIASEDAAEIERQRVAEIKKRAVAKLTPEEIKALGL